MRNRWVKGKGRVVGNVSEWVTVCGWVGRWQVMISYSSTHLKTMNVCNDCTHNLALVVVVAGELIKKLILITGQRILTKFLTVVRKID